MIDPGGGVDLLGDVAEHLDRFRAGQVSGGTVCPVREALDDAERAGSFHIVTRPVGHLAAIGKHGKAARTLFPQHAHQQLGRLLAGDGRLRQGRAVRHAAEPAGSCSSRQIGAVPVALLHIRKGRRALTDKAKCTVYHADEFRPSHCCVGMESAVRIAPDQILTKECLDLPPAPVTAQVSGGQCVCLRTQHQHDQKKREQSFADCFFHSYAFLSVCRFSPLRVRAVLRLSCVNFDCQ